MSNPNISLRPDVRSLPTTIQRIVSSAGKGGSNAEDAGFITDLFLQLYQDRVFVVLSQYAGKIGSILQVTIEKSVIDNSKTYDVVNLLGSKRDDGILELYARRLLEVI